MPPNHSPQPNPPELSVVIPAYNEARRIGPTLVRVREQALRRGQRWELIVVDDGSRDGTAGIVRATTTAPLQLRLLVSRANRGKGHAVRAGMLAASGALVLMCDADLSTPIEQVEKLRPWLERGFEVAIGSRDLPDSLLDPPQPPLRRWAAAVFRTVRRRLLLPGLRDTQCGFKLFRRTAAREIFSRQTLDGWLFDCEVLGLAERLGYRIKEVGVRWGNNPDSRVRAWREALTALPRLLLIRRRLAAINRPAGHAR